jgi:predicted transposase YbfD/YdcC
VPYSLDPLHPSNHARLAQNPLEVFRDLPDPRGARNQLHKLFDIFAIAICAIISGANDWVKVEVFGRSKEEWLRTFLELPNGIPSHDTFDRVFRYVDPNEFEKRFVKWTELVADLLPGQVVAIDGKTLRGSHDNANGLAAIHCVSAFAADNQLILGQLTTDAKSNEITTIPILLETLAIAGCLVTIDAMGCQKAIATKIIDCKGDYLLALKGNQESLADEVDNFFTQAETANFEGVDHVYYKFEETNRGRQEVREIWVTNDIEWLPMLKDWKGLRSIMMIKTKRVVKGKTETETRYYICSLPADAKILKDAARKHWGIENSCHWVLDVTYQEDNSRVRKGYGAENLSRLKRLSLNILKQDKTKKGSIASKRFEAALDDDYRENLLRKAS